MNMTHKFFIGCRVKLIRPIDKFDFGVEGFIESFEKTDEDILDHEHCNCEVVWDDQPDEIYVQHTDQLEVVLPDGAQPSNMSIEELLDSLQKNAVGV